MSRKRPFTKTLVLSATVLVVFCSLAFAIWSYVFAGIDTKPLAPAASGEPSVDSSLGPTREAPHMEEVLNILLIGTDSRNPESRGNSDVLIVLTVNRKQGSLKMMSVMRDLYVPIPGHRTDKINVAYAIGGADLAVRTVNENLGLDITEYVVVDFLGAESVIDAVGGVWIDVKEKEIPYVNESIREENDVIFKDTAPVPLLEEPGLQLLSGRQAVCYARVRKLDSDFQRTVRQRTVLRAMVEQFSRADLVAKTQIVQKGLSSLTTSFSPSEITSLSLEVLPLLQNDIRELRLPTEGDYWIHRTDGWYMVPDRNAMIPKIQEFIWGQTFPFDPYPTIEATVPVTPEPSPEATPSEAPTPAPTATPEPTLSPEPSPEPTLAPQITPEPTSDEAV